MSTEQLIVETVRTVFILIQEPTLLLIVSSGVLLSVILLSFINNLSYPRAAQYTLLMIVVGIFGEGGRYYLSESGAIVTVSLPQTYAYAFLVGFSFSAGLWVTTMAKVVFGKHISYHLRNLAGYLNKKADQYHPPARTSKFKARLSELDEKLSEF